MTEEAIRLSIGQAFFKRCFDVIFSLLAIIILMPLFIIIAIITWLSSNGNIFYTQERLGLNAQPFTIYKFRSMYQHAEKNGPALSFENDKRITTWGKIMRQWKLDELPQLWNIIKGDMSLVGPRPERKYFIDAILQQTNKYNKLLKVKPGLTSAGMVQFGYASTTDELIKRMEYDLAYLEHPSLLLDFKIIIQTIQIIVTGNGK